MSWTFYPISLCRRVSSFEVFQTKVAHLCFCLVCIKKCHCSYDDKSEGARHLLSQNVVTYLKVPRYFPLSLCFEIARKFRRVTIRGALPSPRLCKENLLLRRLLEASAGVFSRFCGGPRDLRGFGGSSDLLTVGTCWRFPCFSFREIPCSSEGFVLVSSDSVG